LKPPPSPSLESDTDELPQAPERVEFVRSFERGINVIKAFGDTSPKLTLSEVAKKTNLARGAARRFLITLQQMGYVGTDGKYFYLLPRTLEIGYAYLSSLPWWKAAQHVAEELARSIGISVAVGVLDKDSALYVAFGLPDTFTVSSRAIGTRLPAYASAIGRVLLALSEPADVDAYLANNHLKPLTSQTETNTDRFKAALENIAQNGFALVDQELAISVKTIAVPIYNRSGMAVAAIGVDLSSLSGTVESLLQSLLPRLRSAASQITESFPI
jgi:IclR family pca regulon transcriptional regulator